MKTIKVLAAAMMMVIAFGATAQERNCLYNVRVNDMRYVLEEKKQNTIEKVGAVLGALAGETNRTDNSYLTPSVSATVRDAISHVRRLSTVNDISDAKFEINGDITSLVTHTSVHYKERTTNDGKTTNVRVENHDASVAITLYLTDIITGQQWTQSFSCNSNWYMTAGSEEEALNEVFNELRRHIVRDYNEMFPLLANIVEAGNAKKDKQQEVYVDLGSQYGIGKGYHFEVFELGEVAGHETRKKIGKLKIEEVMGRDISRCKVEKGHKEIKAALDAGKTLLTVLID